MPKIETMFAFVVADAGPDDEGLVAFHDSKMGWLPMVAAEAKSVQGLLPIAQSIAKKQGKRIQLLEFSVRRLVQVIEP